MMEDEDKKPRGITSFTTKMFKIEAEAREFAVKGTGRTVGELKRLNDGPSDWIVMVPR